MSDLTALANAKRVKTVEVEIDGEDYTFSLIVPVFMKAVELREEAGKLFRLLAELDNLREAFGDKVMDEHETKVVADKAREVKWLRETCTECANMSDDQVANVLRMAGNNSPLVAALMELAIATNSPAVEGLGDLPF